MSRTPHPVAAQPPSPSRGEGRTEDADTNLGNSMSRSDNIRKSSTDLNQNRSQPSPLEGEGGPAKAGPGEGSSAPLKKARPEWRQKHTRRLRPLAKRMRFTPTEAEARMWALLRSRRLADFKFRRQVPIGGYIVDFLCPQMKLVIELDGSQHAGSSADEVRDKWLEDQDFRILRVWNGDLLSQPETVLDAVWSALNGES